MEVEQDCNLFPISTTKVHFKAQHPINKEYYLLRTYQHYAEYPKHNTHLSVPVEVDLPLVEGHHPVVVQVEVLEAGYVCLGRVAVHTHVFPDVLIELGRAAGGRGKEGSAKQTGGPRPTTMILSVADEISQLRATQTLVITKTRKPAPMLLLLPSPSNPLRDTARTQDPHGK